MFLTQGAPWQEKYAGPNGTIVYMGLTFDILNTLGEFFSFE